VRGKIRAEGVQINYVICRKYLLNMCRDKILPAVIQMMSIMRKLKTYGAGVLHVKVKSRKKFLW
jgi:hypothetical protein